MTHKDIKKEVQVEKIQMKWVKEKDLYKTLAMGRNASDAEIKKCYRKKALKWPYDQKAEFLQCKHRRV